MRSETVSRRPSRPAGGRAYRALTLVLLSVLTAGAVAAQRPSDRIGVGEDEVFYQIFVRSFADSNGDGIGDLGGIERQLPYLDTLGVTTLILTPIVPSRFYHNYFASRFDDVDAAFGGPVALQRLIRAAHARHLRILIDMEIQYVPPEHPWWLESAGQPQSRYGGHVVYNGPGNTEPETGFLGTTPVYTYDGTEVHLAMVNLTSPAVQRYFDQLFVSWLRQGIDGFRIDHMMDDLDDRGRLKDLVAGFWAPLLAHARAIRPTLEVVAEQADWKYGDDLLRRGGVDAVYAFPLHEALVALDRDRIARALETTWAKTPPGKAQLVFLENHDTNRFASEVDGDPAKERLGAALAVLLKGTPLIYYGQELGMRGKRSNEGLSDGNDIPDREAFRWKRVLDSAGTALWYRGAGVWWTDRYARDGDGVSVEEETGDPRSLLSFYRRLLALRRDHASLRSGTQQILDVGAPAVLAVRRAAGRDVALILANCSDEATTVHLARAIGSQTTNGARVHDLLDGAAFTSGDDGEWVLPLGPYATRLLAR